MKRQVAVGALVSLVQLLSACMTITSTALSSADDPSISLIDTAWTVDRLGATPASSSGLSLHIARDSLSGSDGCNDFNGPIEIGAAILRVGQPLVGRIGILSDLSEVSLRSPAPLPKSDNAFM